MFKVSIKKIINFTICFRSIIVLSKSSIKQSASLINILHVKIFLFSREH